MEVVNKQPIPIYEIECEECKSKIRYRKSEVPYYHITCPACGTKTGLLHIHYLGKRLEGE